ncbi:hypothetical protein BDZ91DRAFT_731825 [Kalaharituber pfeilii]|nr:hypothetical protein BDZ91DRAFT_731825 [Kalaharituber pfeilii]
MKTKLSHDQPSSAQSNILLFPLLNVIAGLTVFVVVSNRHTTFTHSILTQTWDKTSVPPVPVLTNAI